MTYNELFTEIEDCYSRLALESVAKKILDESLHGNLTHIEQIVLQDAVEKQNRYVKKAKGKL